MSDTTKPVTWYADEIRKRLNPNDLYDEQACRAGLEIEPAPDGGAYIRRRNDTGEIIRLLRETDYPKLNVALADISHGAAVDVMTELGRGSEKPRQVASIDHRIAFVEQEMAAGRAVGLESLDDSRALPTARQTATGRVPRAITWVTLNPPPATRHFAFSEQRIAGGSGVSGTIRPDEVKLTYHLSAEELDYIKQNPTKPYREIPTANRPVKLLEVFCFDVNKPMSVEDLVEHFLKTQEGMIAAVSHALDKAGIHVQDTITILARARDAYLESAELRADTTGIRQLRRGTGTLTYEVSLTATKIAGAVDVVRAAKPLLTAIRIPEAAVQQITTAMAAVEDALIAALKAAKALN